MGQITTPLSNRIWQVQWDSMEIPRTSMVMLLIRFFSLYFDAFLQTFSLCFFAEQDFRMWTGKRALLSLFTSTSRTLTRGPRWAGSASRPGRSTKTATSRRPTPPIEPTCTDALLFCHRQTPTCGNCIVITRTYPACEGTETICASSAFKRKYFDFVVVASHLGQ